MSEPHRVGGDHPERPGRPYRRYALYFAPPADHPLGQAGATWLGRDAHAGQPLTPPASPERAEPWRYGFHATLKAPLRLAAGASEADFLQAVSDLAATRPRFAMPTLTVAQLGDFLALRPSAPLAPDHPLQRLADTCVIELDRWRAPMDAAEQARRLQPGYTPRQREHLLRHGYPHVLQDWRFHMTLSDSLKSWSAAAVAQLTAQAQTHFAPALQAPLCCDALCVFVEPAPGAPLVLAHREGLRPV